jgi:hypothetical protein
MCCNIYIYIYASDVHVLCFNELAHAVLVGKKRIMLSHAKVCDGECTNVKCNHRSHASRRRRTMTTQQKRAALMAGFKPQEDIEFKNVLQQKLQQAGVDRYTHM